MHLVQEDEPLLHPLCHLQHGWACCGRLLHSNTGFCAPSPATGCGSADLALAGPLLLLCGNPFKGLLRPHWVIPAFPATAAARSPASASAHGSLPLPPRAEPPAEPSAAPPAAPPAEQEAPCWRWTSASWAPTTPSPPPAPPATTASSGKLRAWRQAHPAGDGAGRGRPYARGAQHRAGWKGQLRGAPGRRGTPRVLSPPLPPATGTRGRPAPLTGSKMRRLPAELDLVACCAAAPLATPAILHGTSVPQPFLCGPHLVPPSPVVPLPPQRRRPHPERRGRPDARGGLRGVHHPLWHRRLHRMQGGPERAVPVVACCRVLTARWIATRRGVHTPCLSPWTRR